MSTTVRPDEPLSSRSEVRTVPSFSNSSGPVSSLLPEDNGCEDHDFSKKKLWF
jgi:hypothetical protein